MNANAVTGIVFRADQILIVLVGGGYEEGREDLVVVQYLKEFFRVSAGTVVKGQVDDLFRVRFGGLCCLRGSGIRRSICSTCSGTGAGS